ncbi:hypothetical protein LDO26_10525 [Luteimonas sp. BDR2-5]|uniref:HD domain-containing protein n=1 Tax=Proluteimonas luteida TaxID=2878685 RepID=UPI001E56F910|nr:hypothetical protein [Luteimonas sp. BDR2-5]MCD9028639.1 hypothetical protein [Luteimonas sp. BDR2-5]
MASSAPTPLALPAPMREALAQAYATPPRAYHNQHHIDALLLDFDAVAATGGWAQPREVWLAILYHDAIYEAGRKDNEARSAQLAAREIARWLPDAGIDVARVVELIELTACHGALVPDDFPADARGDDTRRFLDCDMAILGAPPEAFDAYDRAIAAEYRQVPRWLYALNRRKFLKALLARERIFLSDGFHARLDAQARANLRRAITTKR